MNIKIPLFIFLKGWLGSLITIHNESLINHVSKPIQIIEDLIISPPNDFKINKINIYNTNIPEGSGFAYQNGTIFLSNQNNNNYFVLNTKQGLINISNNEIILIHELFHILGIGISNKWYQNLRYNNNYLFYIGKNGLNNYKNMLKNNFFVNTSNILGIPIENVGMLNDGTFAAHLKEGFYTNPKLYFDYVYDTNNVSYPILPREIMTGYLNMGENFISNITLGILEDLGYFVNYSSIYNYNSINENYFIFNV
tara:strand:+ start:827 stop:1585 length:759 start_codon:yes stop_codon:yes gene_type:complete